MTIKPCYRCRLRSGCEIRIQKLAAVRGLGLTSFTFRCETQRADLRSGQHCVAHLHDMEWDRDVDLDAIFIHWSGPPAKTKAVVYFPESQPSGYEGLPSVKREEIIRILGVSHDRLTPLEACEPDPCPKCGWPAGIEVPKGSEWWCPLCAPGVFD